MSTNKSNFINKELTDKSSVVGAATLNPQQQFLRFLLEPNLMVLIELDTRIQSQVSGLNVRHQVTELVDIPFDRVVPMPHLPPAVMGIYNWRGEILWVVDLAVLVGEIGRHRHYHHLQSMIIISETEDIHVGSSRIRTSATNIENHYHKKSIGLVVDEIAEIEWYQLDLMRDPEPTDRIPSQLLGWLRGVMESIGGEKFLVLDGRAIFDRANIHADV